MCLFTHFAGGALAGAATNNVWFGAVVGIISHAVLDALPHYDHPDWRVELGGGIAALVFLLLLPFWTWPAVVGGIMGMVPDLENLFQKLGRMRRDQFIFPSHTGLIPHGRSLARSSLIWQLTIFIVCFCGIGLLNPALAAAEQTADSISPTMDRPTITVIESRPGLSIVRVDFPVAGDNFSWAETSPQQLRWLKPGPIIENDTDQIVELPPTAQFSLAQPSDLVARWRVVATTWWLQPHQEVNISDQITVSRPRVYREVPLFTVSVCPLTASDGVLSSITLELSHPAVAARAKQLDKARDVFTNEVEIDVPATVINPSVFTSLRRGAYQLLHEKTSGPKAGSTSLFGLTSNWVMIEVDQTGIHKVNGNDLREVGLIPDGVDPATLRLFHGGGEPLANDPEFPADEQARSWQLQEIPIEVQDSGDGQWDDLDVILFYGFGTSTWLDRLDPTAEPLEHFEHRDEQHGKFWLTWEDYGTDSPLPGSPKRINAVSAAPNAGEIVDAHQGRLHEERSFFDDPGLFEDSWSWDHLITGEKHIDFSLPELVNGSEVAIAIDLRADRVSRTPAYEYSVRSFLNGAEAAADSFSFLGVDQFGQGRVIFELDSDDAVSGQNTLHIDHYSYASGNNGREPLALDFFNVKYWSPLNKLVDQQLEVVHWGEQVSAPATDYELQFSLPDINSVSLWDVSDPLNITSLSGSQIDGSNPSYSVGLIRDPDTNRHLVLFAESDVLQPVSLALHTPRFLAGDSALDPEAIDYVVIYPEPFADAANDLAALRNQILPGVSSPHAVAVDAADIYANYSGGQKDPMALRNFLRWLYLAGNTKLQYVCLLGNASRDYRNYLGHDPDNEIYDYVPTIVRTYYPGDRYTGSHFRFYATDDVLVEFDTYSIADGTVDIPDLAIGRIPVNNAAEANRVVSTIAEYSTNPPSGSWRSKVTMVADDFGDLRSPQRGHMRQAEDLDKYFIPKTIETNKIYLELYDSPASGYKPAARLDLLQKLNAGTTIFCYIGHGGETVLADEHVFRMSDISGLTNGLRLSVFMAYSCQVGIFDSPIKQSISEEFVNQVAGAGIGSICSSQVSYPIHNDFLSDRVFLNLFPDRTTVHTSTLGKAVNLAKTTPEEYSPFPGQQLLVQLGIERYSLMGDPAIHLPHPVGDMSFSSATPDTLYSGQRSMVQIDLGDQGLAPGSSLAYEFRIEESARQVQHVSTYVDDDNEEHDVSFNVIHPGSPVFRGNGSIEQDQLVIPFKVPTQMHYGDDGKARLIIETPTGLRAAYKTISMVSTAVNNDDVIGPAVALSSQGSPNNVRIGDNLTATITDTSGIGILGTYPNNSVLIEFDNNGYMTNVSESFVFDAGSYTRGSISIPLSTELELGEHVAALHASDVLGNVGSDTLSFLLVTDGITEFFDVSLFPNPSTGPCRLVFETTDPLDVTWDIYTLAGRRINSVKEQYDTAGIKILHWNGRDLDGDELANGVYLYVLRGSWAGNQGRDIKETGKLVIMR